MLWNFQSLVQDWRSKREVAMRILSILSGASVLFTTLAYGHLVHHFFVNSPREEFHNPLFWAANLAALAAGVFSFVGGFLLLKRSR